MTIRLLGIVAVLLGLACIIWPSQVSELNDRLTLFPRSFSRGFMIAMGIIALLIGVFFVSVEVRPRHDRSELRHVEP